MRKKHYGLVRGGMNEKARFFLHIHTEFDENPEEMSAIFGIWDEEFGMHGKNWSGRCYSINSRREFSCLPTMIRKAERLGYKISTSMWGEGIKGEVFLDEDPASFWKCLALAQAFFTC